MWLENAAGRRILDLYGGHAVAALGYGHPRLSEAIARQARDLVFQTNALPLKVRDEAAEALAAFGPAGLGRVFFVNSGAEANENALRLALKVTGRPKIVAFEHSFHGRTAAAAAVTWGAQQSWYGFPRTPFDVQFVARGDVAALNAAVDCVRPRASSSSPSRDSRARSTSRPSSCTRCAPRATARARY